MSMGGEEAIGATATNHLLRAVVAEGATARAAPDEAWLSDRYGVRGALQEQLERVQDWVTDALTDASVPTSIRAAVEASGRTRYLLITAGNEPDEGHAAAHVAAAAPDRVADLDREGCRAHRRSRGRPGMDRPSRDVPDRGGSPRRVNGGPA